MTGRRAVTGPGPVTGLVSLPLLLHTWRSQRVRVLVVALALAVWGFLMPVIYATFGRQFAVLIDSGMIPDVFLKLMGADPFSLDGVIALGAVHPAAIALLAVFPVGWGAAAIAGERQRGTLEVLLARPLSRRTLVLTLATAVVLFALVTTLALYAGNVLGAAAYGLAGEIDGGELALLALNTALLFASLGMVALAASSTFDRLAPAVGVALAVLLLGYVLEILGALWPDAAFLQPLSPLHYLQPLDILAGDGSASDLAVLAALAIAALAHMLFWFPRRDLAAPT